LHKNLSEVQVTRNINYVYYSKCWEGFQGWDDMLDFAFNIIRCDKN